MQKIIVKTQAEYDQIPDDFDGVIIINAPKYPRIVLEKKKGYSVEAWGNSSVEAWGNSSVEARENSSVEAWENSSVEARENSSVVAWGNSSVEAWGNSSVEARENSSVEAWGNSSVEARENSSVEARENSSVEAWGNSSVEAWGNSSVEAWGNSSVEAWGNSSVEARGNSSVEAWGNSSVVAWGNSSVEGGGNSQICLNSKYAKVSTRHNSRIVQNPKEIKDYCAFHDIKTEGDIAILYKAVREDLCSIHDHRFQYEIGKTYQHECDQDVTQECSTGLHLSHLAWAVDFGRERGRFKVIECSTPMDKVIIPEEGSGKVRTSELTVIREVPPEEWGVYGKIYLKRLQSWDS